MNAPGSAEHFVLDDDEKKVTYQVDSKIVDSGTFRVNKEDHTLGNMMRMSLLEDERVVFAGYRMPHPLEFYFNLKVRTRSDITPVDAVLDSVKNLTKEMSSLEQQFRDQVSNHNHDNDNNPAWQ